MLNLSNNNVVRSARITLPGLPRPTPAYTGLLAHSEAHDLTGLIVLGNEVDGVSVDAHIGRRVLRYVWNTSTASYTRRDPVTRKLDTLTPLWE